MTVWRAEAGGAKAIRRALPIKMVESNEQQGVSPRAEKMQSKALKRLTGAKEECMARISFPPVIPERDNAPFVPLTKAESIGEERDRRQKEKCAGRKNFLKQYREKIMR